MENFFLVETDEPRESRVNLHSERLEPAPADDEFGEDGVGFFDPID